MVTDVTNPSLTGPGGSYGLPRVMNVEEAANFLRLNVKTIYAAIESGIFPGRRVGKRIVILKRCSARLVTV